MDEYFYKCGKCGMEISHEELEIENKRRRELNQAEAVFVDCDGSAIPADLPKDEHIILIRRHFSQAVAIDLTGELEMRAETLLFIMDEQIQAAKTIEKVLRDAIAIIQKTAKELAEVR